MASPSSGFSDSRPKCWAVYRATWRGKQVVLKEARIGTCADLLGRDARDRLLQRVAGAQVFEGISVSRPTPTTSSSNRTTPISWRNTSTAKHSGMPSPG